MVNELKYKATINSNCATRVFPLFSNLSQIVAFHGVRTWSEAELAHEQPAYPEITIDYDGHKRVVVKYSAQKGMGPYTQERLNAIFETGAGDMVLQYLQHCFKSPELGMLISDIAGVHVRPDELYIALWKSVHLGDKQFLTMPDNKTKLLILHKVQIDQLNMKNVGVMQLVSIALWHMKANGIKSAIPVEDMSIADFVLDQLPDTWPNSKVRYKGQLETVPPTRFIPYKQTSHDSWCAMDN